MDTIADLGPMAVALALCAWAIQRIATKAGLERICYIVGVVVGGFLGAMWAIQERTVTIGEGQYVLPWSGGIAVGIGMSALTGEVGAWVADKLKSRRKPDGDPGAPR